MLITIKCTAGQCTSLLAAKAHAAVVCGTRQVSQWQGSCATEAKQQSRSATEKPGVTGQI